MRRRILLLVIIFCLSFNVNAKSDFRVCEYTDSFMEWLNLSENEKNNSLMPIVCKSNTSKSDKASLFLKRPMLKSTIMPTSYDLRNVSGNSYVTDVLDQGNRGTCWAFSSLSSLESKMLMTELGEYNFSRNHIEYATTDTFLNNETYSEGYNRELGSGGNMLLAAAYYLTEKGPIADSDMPYTSNDPLIELSSILGHESLVDVNTIEFIKNEGGVCTADTIEKIKSLVVENGAVDAGMYLNASYFNQLTAAYYYNGNSSANHAVNIIGWNDNYAKTNFLNEPSANGAFIVQNSYGTSFGENGYFYISYEDINICTQIASVVSVDKSFSDNNYYYDYLGYNGGYGSGSTNIAYAANVFDKKSDELELLKEVTIATFKDTSYTIYVNPEGDTLNSTSLIEVDSGIINYEGYTTIDLTTPLYLNGNKFAVAVKYQVTNNNYPVPVQLKFADSIYDSSPVLVGKSYISRGLDETWEDLSNNTLYYPIASIKAGTMDVTYKVLGAGISKGLMITGGTVNILKNLIGNNLGTIKIYNKELTTEITTGILKTGYNLVIEGELNDGIIPIVVLGDVNGDGIVDILDIVKIGRHVVSLENINERVNLASCDFDSNGIVDILDIVKIGILVTGGI